MTDLSNEQKRGLLDFANRRRVRDGSSSLGVRNSVSALRGNKHLAKAAYVLGLESAYDRLNEKGRRAA